MIELSPNIDTIPLPGRVLCPSEHIDAVLAQVHSASDQLTRNRKLGDEVPLLLFEMQMQQQQQ